MTGKPMTPEQIKNWRDVLCGMIGPYALMIPDEQIVKMRNRLQEQVKEQNPHCGTFLKCNNAEGCQGCEYEGEDE